jgi:hypothetical protein
LEAKKGCRMGMTLITWNIKRNADMEDDILLQVDNGDPCMKMRGF